MILSPEQLAVLSEAAKNATPGPWEIYDQRTDADAVGYGISPRDQLGDICRITKRKQLIQSWHEANAALIATTPDLLETCLAQQAELATDRAQRADLSPFVAMAMQDAAIDASEQSPDWAAGIAENMLAVTNAIRAIPLTFTEAELTAAALRLPKIALRLPKIAALVDAAKAYAFENDCYDEENETAMRAWRSAREKMDAAIAKLEAGE
jgi:hypothetical protein